MLKGAAFSCRLNCTMYMLGVLFVVLSSIIYGIDPTIRQMVIDSGVSPIEEIFIGYAFSTIIAVFCCLVRGKPLKLKPREAGQLPLVGCIGSGLCTILLVNAYQYIPVGCAVVIHFLYPTIVCIAMSIFFKQRLTYPHIAAIILSIAGLICVSSSVLGSSAVGILLAAASSFAYAYYIVAMDNTSLRNLPVETRTLYVCAYGTLVSLIFLIFSKPSHAVTFRACGVLALCVTFSMAGTYLFLAGLSRIGSTASAFLSLFEPVASVITSTIVFRYKLSCVMMCGCFLVLAAIAFASLGNRLAVKRAARLKE